MGIRSIKDYKKATSIEEALQLINEDNYKILAGGTDLIPELKKITNIENENSISILDIKGIRQLSGVKILKDKIKLGPLATIENLKSLKIFANHKYFAIREACNNFASWQIRNRATVGGNICTANPAADIVSALLALGSSVIISRIDEMRELPLDKFFLEEVKIHSNELLTEINIPISPRYSGSAFLKRGKRKAVSTSVLNMSIYLSFERKSIIKDIRISVGGAAPIPLRLYKAEKYLMNKNISSQTIEEAGLIAISEIRPRSKYEYKQQLCKIFLKRGIYEIQQNISREL